jgi:hypothetical protein
VEVALGNILNYLKTRSNRYSVVMHQDQLREAAKDSLAGSDDAQKKYAKRAWSDFVDVLFRFGLFGSSLRLMRRMRGKVSKSASDGAKEEAAKAVTRTLQRDPSLSESGMDGLFFVCFSLLCFCFCLLCRFY